MLAEKEIELLPGLLSKFSEFAPLKFTVSGTACSESTCLERKPQIP
jgi:hypothetical protein